MVLIGIFNGDITLLLPLYYYINMVFNMVIWYLVWYSWGYEYGNIVVMLLIWCLMAFNRDMNGIK